jgi:hypothetical protein
MSVVRLKKDEPRFKLKANDLLYVDAYFMDPQTKCLAVLRLHDGRLLSNTLYWTEVEKVPWSRDNRNVVLLMYPDSAYETSPAEYYKNRHQTSVTACPCCGGHTWVDFDVEQSEAEALFQDTALDSWVDMPQYSVGSPTQCVDCGCVVS